MDTSLPRINIQVGERIYLKDPESSDLGRRIVTSSIVLIESMGFEAFNFKKLGKEINSPEASIYRYFESKHKLLLYLSSWYWGWMEYRLLFAVANIESPIERLKRVISLITDEVEQDSSFTHINEIKLHRIVISESSKAFLTKEVDKENSDGSFLGYKQFVARIAEIILEIKPDYQYSRMLVSTAIEGAHLQRFFAKHLPNLTDSIEGEDSVSYFYKNMIFKSLSIDCESQS